MKLLFSYLGLMILGDLLAYFIGLFVEREGGPIASLWVFLILYFLFLWIAWVIAVRITEPKNVGASQPSPVLSPTVTPVRR
jgi:hypothetical protein